MYNHAGPFVDHHDVIVFKHNVDGNVLGNYFSFPGWFCKYNGNYIAGPYLVVLFNGLIINKDAPCRGCLLDLVS